MSKTPIFDEFWKQRGKFHGSEQEARTVIFSYEGWNKAQREQLTADNCIQYTPPTYCGLPHLIDPTQAADIVVTHEYLAEVQARVLPAGTHRPRQRAITVRGTFGKFGGEEPKTMVQLVASSLDAATLCDIIMEWLGADCNWGDFEKELHAVVEKHGRFE